MLNADFAGFARCVKSTRGQWENLWAAEPCNVVRLVTDEDIEDKIAYVVANPVAAGLVKQPEQWPGVLLWGQGSQAVPRPDSYFRKDGTCPAELPLVIEPPEPRDGPPIATREWKERVTQSVASKVTAAHRALREAGREFLGRAAVLATSFVQRARSYEARFGLIPTFAAKVRAVRNALGRVERHFRARYRKALELWRRGWRDVAFPLGTWGMVVWHSVAVARAADT